MSIVSSEEGMAELEDEVVGFFSRGTETGASGAPSELPLASRFLRLSRLFLFARPFWVEGSLFIFVEEGLVGGGVCLASMGLLVVKEGLTVGGVEEDAVGREGLGG